MLGEFENFSDRLLAMKEECEIRPKIYVLRMDLWHISE